MKTQKFYDSVKPHMSPSALDTWLNQRSSFIKSYFEGTKGPETKAMTAGKNIHALIDAGIFKVQKSFEINEETITIEIKKGYTFLGIPDSMQKIKKGASIVHFCDYKTGKENPWKEKLPSDIKMKATAWLVWHKSGKPAAVTGFVEYIPTEWDAENKQVVPIEGAETEVHSITYDALELKEFTDVILKAMDDVNEAYETWLTSTGEFVSEPDMEVYAELKKQKDEIESKMKEIAERLQSQMEFGHKSTIPTRFGTFFITERKTWEYPKDLSISVNHMQYLQSEVEEIVSAAKVAQKNYELTAEPKTVTRSLGFRIAKE
jgi:hypothetical protein